MSSIFELETLEVKLKNTDNGAALALAAAIEHFLEIGDGKQERNRIFTR